jgi:hypothetical protein
METYSQRNQDLFAAHILNNKTNGTFLDFGCRGPVSINNTYLFEKKFNFKGLSFDIDRDAINEWKTSDRNYNNAYCVDLLALDLENTLDKFYTSNIIDYFTFDLEPPL